MAELSQQERLQPSLLDRLTDDEPGNTKESRDKRVLSLSKLRQSVMRDLAWLFNTTNLAAVQDLADFPEAARSVVNYGMPDLAGHTASSVDVKGLEKLLRDVIHEFEPRILRNSIRVRLVVDEERMSHNAMVFEIHGQLWAQPTPLDVFLRTELDLEIGDVRVTDFSAQ